MSVVLEARDEMLAKLKKLEPGSDEILRQTKVVQILSDIEKEDRKLIFEETKEETRKLEKASELEFDREKEETRKLEKSNEFVYSQVNTELRKIDLAIHALDVLLNPGARLLGLILNNKTRVKRDKMGYEFEENGVIGSHTFVNSQKDKYD